MGQNADFMPIDGWDYLELYVGNAKQAAHFYEHAFGFTPTAYAGPETGVRDRASIRAPGQCADDLLRARLLVLRAVGPAHKNALAAGCLLGYRPAVGTTDFERHDASRRVRVTHDTRLNVAYCARSGAMTCTPTIGRGPDRLMYN